MNNETTQPVFFWLLAFAVSCGLILIGYTFLQQYNSKEALNHTVYQTCQDQNGTTTFVAETETRVEYSEGREIVAADHQTTVVCGYNTQ